ncbi:hypothetical protein ACFXKI_48725 [Streptomyces mirabilis]|uniref:hypothetical protein n=1 Tax=Streptomyces TaxID=1883 RepID=UPI002E2CD3B8|nr:hypothetical protein [Streptomyces sp. NBC_00271]
MKAFVGVRPRESFGLTWKYYNNVPVSSFYLEMRAAQYMAGEPNFIAIWDICGLLEKLEGHQLAAMNDPKNKAGRFAACSSVDGHVIRLWR